MTQRSCFPNFFHSSLPFGQAALKWKTTCLAPCPLAKWEWKVTCPAGKPSCPGRLDGNFFFLRLHVHNTVSRARFESSRTSFSKHLSWSTAKPANQIGSVIVDYLVIDHEETHVGFEDKNDFFLPRGFCLSSLGASLKTEKNGYLELSLVKHQIVQSTVTHGFEWNRA